MSRRYLAFDIEISKLLPTNVEDLKAHRPLGISCASALADDDEEPHLWYSSNPNGSPASKMSRQDASDLVDFLLQQVSEGSTILTWNGLSFDFDILAEESGRLSDCRDLAMDHVDMMFHVFCEKGFGVGLNAAAKGIGIKGKPQGFDAAMAPQQWADGNTQTVLDYVANDSRMTLGVAAVSEEEREFAWITKRGSRSSFYLRRGWRTVQEALKMPEPDTSWMTTPAWPRSRFTDWCS